MQMKALLRFTFSLTLSCSFVASQGYGASTEKKAAAEQVERNVLFLLVDKSNLRADLMTWPENYEQSERLASFRIAIGKEEGDKQVEGDNRTPEGIYFAQTIIDGDTLPAKYGPYAIPINFPNEHDRFIGKTGYGIWLHGVEKDARVEEAKVTEGCVAFYNADIDSLTKWLKPRHSIIVIAKNADQVNKPQDVEQVQNMTKEWVSAWKIRDTKKYISFYAKEFRSRGMSLKQYADYKQRVFASYNQMQINMEQMRVFTHDKYALAIMNQDFNGDNRYISQGRKILYWVKDDAGQWKILHEVFGRSLFEMQSFSRDFIAKLSSESPSSKQFPAATESAASSL